MTTADLVVDSVDEALIKTVEHEQWDKTQERPVSQQRSKLGAYTLCYHSNTLIRCISETFMHVCSTLASLPFSAKN